MRRLRAVLVLIVGVLPASTTKNKLLNALGHDVHKSAVIDPVVIFNVGRMQVDSDARISIGNVFKNLRGARVGSYTLIGPWNFIWANPKFRSSPEADPEHVGVFSIGKSCLITRRHNLDASGGIVISDWSGLAGRSITMMSHSYDPKRHVMACAVTRMEESSFVASSCIMAVGATLPERSVLAMGAVLMPGATAPHALYAGVPAKVVRPDISDWVAFDYSEDGTRTRTPAHSLPNPRVLKNR
ncbi:MAG: acyltransferase [Geodermatophilaceae bacterium]|jgi:acetyltransferase-like isoleucine patch superfamily enzyme|nr:hypothetical protein [Geodermatophilaceae bacterium]